MRRLVPVLLSFVLALSGLCTFTCFAQVTAKDAHACCHGKNKGAQHSLMVVQSRLPVAVQHATPVQIRTVEAFSTPLTTGFQSTSSIASPVFRSLPPLILRL